MDQDGAKMGKRGAKKRPEVVLKCGRARQTWDGVKVLTDEHMLGGCRTDVGQKAGRPRGKSAQMWPSQGGKNVRAANMDSGTDSRWI